MNTNILPDTDGAYNIGSDTLRWKAIYLKGSGTIINVISMGGGPALKLYGGDRPDIVIQPTEYHPDYSAIRVFDDAGEKKFEVKFGGDVWATSYNTWSPKLPTLSEVRKNPEIAYKELHKIACIPSSEGKLEHIKDPELKDFILKRAFAKDISKTALLNARLVVILYEKVKQLEKENAELKQRIAELEAKLS